MQRKIDEEEKIEKKRNPREAGRKKKEKTEKQKLKVDFCVTIIKQAKIWLIHFLWQQATV